MEEAVWAKLRYCPYWPAKIVDVPLGLKKQPRKFCVYFFGTNNYGFVEMDKTVSYLQHKSKYVKKGRGKKFTEAVAFCDEYIHNPSVHPIPAQKQILLAKEYEFEVKKEPKDENLWYTNEVVDLHPTKSCKDCAEKQIEIDLLTAENTRLKQKLDAQSQTIVDLQMALQHSKQDSDSDNENEMHDHYEVEKLLNHKIQNGEQMFFVKWKGFNKRHNSWVKESDLNCEKMLRNYLNKLE